MITGCHLIAAVEWTKLVVLFHALIWIPLSMVAIRLRRAQVARAPLMLYTLLWAATSFFWFCIEYQSWLPLVRYISDPWRKVVLYLNNLLGACSLTWVAVAAWKSGKARTVGSRT